MEKGRFLATTALEEFWDVEQPMLFLGQWCLLYDRSSYWAHLDGYRVENHEVGSDELHARYHQDNKIYERILPVVAQALNAIHETRHSDRYWRIVIGPWLQTYVAAVHDRFRRIVKVLEAEPALTTCLLSSDSFVVPLDTREFTLRLTEDSYNLQIYSKIFLFLGKKFSSKTYQQTKSSSYSIVGPRSTKQKLFAFATGVARSLVKKTALNPVVISNSYLSKISEIKLAFAFRGKVFSTTGMVAESQQLGYDKNKRKALEVVSFGEDDFSKCLASLLFSDVPKCFIEGYEAALDAGRRKYPNSPKFIFSANSWWYDETFKCWAAAQASRGIPLLGTPHGHYCVRLDQPSRKHEIDIVDRYYPWSSFFGTALVERRAEVTSMPATKFMNIENLGASNNLAGVLWVTTVVSRYSAFELPFSSAELFENYLLWHERFVDSLSKESLLAIRFRPHPLDFGWSVVARIRSHHPDIVLDNHRDFLESLSQCRLYVCDHLSTTFAEAIAANKPTILFWSTEANKMLPQAQKYFELLRDVGVFFSTPEEAAAAVNNHYADVESWWNEPRRQDAVSIFREELCRTSPNALSAWIEELQKFDTKDA